MHVFFEGGSKSIERRGSRRKKVCANNFCLKINIRVKKKRKRRELFYMSQDIIEDISLFKRKDLEKVFLLFVTRAFFTKHFQAHWKDCIRNTRTARHTPLFPPLHDPCTSLSTTCPTTLSEPRLPRNWIVILFSKAICKCYQKVSSRHSLPSLSLSLSLFFSLFKPLFFFIRRSFFVSHYLIFSRLSSL